MNSTGIDTGRGGRSDVTKSTAVWRFHQRHHSRSYTKCFSCGTRTRLRLRKEDEIRPLCITHFCAETGTSEEIMKRKTDGRQRKSASDNL